MFKHNRSSCSRSLRSRFASAHCRAGGTQSARNHTRLARLVTELGGDKLTSTATKRVSGRASRRRETQSVARARTADLVVATGADLEIGWMPVLLQDSGNSKIQPGSPGYFEAAPLVPLLEVPSAVDRSMGDIHPLGNPHVTLDPRKHRNYRQGARPRAWY